MAVFYASDRKTWGRQRGRVEEMRRHIHALLRVPARMDRRIEER